MPGVLAIFPVEDVARWGLGPLPCATRPQPKSGTTMCRPPRPALATRRVRYVGEAIAMVFAENPDAALDAVESIDVSYTPLDPVIDLAAALAPGAPRLHEEADDNFCLTGEKGEAAAGEKGRAQAAHR